MTFAVQHVHIKTRDPKQTVQFYVDNFGATLKPKFPGAVSRSICMGSSSTSPR